MNDTKKIMHPALINWRTDDFDFELPPERIAAQPASPRDHARLLRVTTDNLGDHHVYDLPNLLREGDLLVMNDTKVIPARLYGTRGQGRVEIFLHKRLVARSSAPAIIPMAYSEIAGAEPRATSDKTDNQEWLAFARPLKRLKEGDEIVFAQNFTCKIKKKTQDADIIVTFDGDEKTLIDNLNKHGRVPLPPYIKRPKGDNEADKTNYQTVYAKNEGAVAAPTAGLHFTPELLKSLREKKIGTETLTLHVGAGTFLPVKADYLKDHVMHAEWGEITPQAAQKINQARQTGRRIVAVGTTSLRLLESATDDNGFIRAFKGETDIFIYPGYRFKAVDALLTNFHLPKSTLFMLVSAFSGLERMKSAYKHAITSGYRFYSYGDATLLEKAL